MRADSSDQPTNELQLATVDAAIALCTADGELVGASPSALALFARAGVECESLPVSLPGSLLAALLATPNGQSNEWRPEAEPDLCLGWTRYRAGQRVVLLIREIAARQRELSRRLHQQRLETIGMLVAGIAHNLRTPLASAAFAASVLRSREADLGANDVDCVRTIGEAIERMRDEIAGLLHFARLGPAPHGPPTRLDEIVQRVSALVRPLLRERHHELRVDMREPGLLVRGNPLVIEQIVTNLVINAAESAPQELHIVVRVGRSPEPRSAAVDVIDDGPGVPAGEHARIFEPFYSSKRDGTGLGLTISREAAREIGGELRLLPVTRGAHFRLTLLVTPASGGPPP